MPKFITFILSLFLLPFHHSGGLPHPTPTPTPPPIVFHSYPASHISVDWGSSAPDFTIFLDPDAKPCDVTTRQVIVTNSGSASRPLSLKGFKTSESKDFSGILNLTIYKSSTIIYGPHTLSQFFTTSSDPAGVSLGTLAGNSSAVYKFVVEFPCSAGNQYQQAKIVFDLKLGKLLNIPDNCRRFRQDDGHEFNCDPRHHQVFTTFDHSDRIDDHDPNQCRTIYPDH